VACSRPRSPPEHQFAPNKFDNAARVAALGAGMVLPAARLRPSRLAKRLDGLIRRDTFGAHCSLLASRFSPAHDLNALCSQVGRLVMSKREAA
jgi:rhamnosyltransferase subunit B